jgi:hypothetical protein
MNEIKFVGTSKSNEIALNQQQKKSLENEENKKKRSYHLIGLILSYCPLHARAEYVNESPVIIRQYLLFIIKKMKKCEIDEQMLMKR